MLCALFPSLQNFTKCVLFYNFVIDEIINTVSSWYLFNEFQEKPVIINLWGLTGTGKTSLIYKLVEYLNISESFLHVDYNEEKFEKILSVYHKVNIDKKRICFLFDEFQSTRTVNDDGDELYYPSNNYSYLWEFLDTGKYRGKVDNEFVSLIKEQINEINIYLANFDNNEKTSTTQEESNENKYKTNKFQISDELLNQIFLFMPAIYFKINELLENINETSVSELHKILREMLNKAVKPVTYDFSKSLIFVVGNLDEAYKMSKNLNADISPDSFYEDSLKIQITTIKKALQKRFRNEQISRLGNTHVIYPAFNTKTFYQIIKMNLAKISEQFYEKQGINLEFSQSIIDLIYKEGVYPTQGARPILSTINNLIVANLSDVVTKIYFKKLNVNKIRFRALKKKILVEYFYKNEIILERQLNVLLKLENLRKNKKDDMQAIVAVHESGHAIASIFLMYSIPSVIYSVTSDREKGGFTFSQYNKEFFRKRDIINHLAVLIAGQTAEKLVFGEEDFTAGSQNDLETVSEFVNKMIKYNGMCNLPAKLQSGFKDFDPQLTVNENKVDAIAKNLIKEAEKLAKSILIREERLLLRMSHYLSNNREMKKAQILEFCEKYSNNCEAVKQMSRKETGFYRKMLLFKLKNLERNNFVIETLEKKFILNKGKNE